MFRETEAGSASRMGRQHLPLGAEAQGASTYNARIALFVAAEFCLKNCLLGHVISVDVNRWVLCVSLTTALFFGVNV